MSRIVRYLLDTNVLSETTRPSPDPGVLRRLLEAEGTAAIAAPAWHELTFGFERMPKGRRRRAISDFMADLERVLHVLPYDKSAANWHARERVRLEKKGRLPPFIDGQIAAIAVSNNLTLVTRNLNDFAQFKELKTESWFERPME